jgi:hypothetical protein
VFFAMLTYSNRRIKWLVVSQHWSKVIQSTRHPSVLYIKQTQGGVLSMNHGASMSNQQHHNRPQAGWTRRFAPRLCAGRYALITVISN